MINSVQKRDIFDKVTPYLGTNNVIVLHGARQTGKTYILYYLEDYLKKQKRQAIYIDLEDSRYLDILNAGPDQFLQFLSREGFSNREIYVLIDEIQYMDKPSPFIKLLADHHQNIRLILSGSSSFSIKQKFSDSLVGRTVEFTIYPLSFSEFLKFKKITSKFDLKAYYQEYVSYGGYPKIVLENSVEKKEKYLQQIIDTYIRKDVRDLANIKSPQRFNNLLKLLASQSGQLVNITQLSSLSGLAIPTVEHYLFILENTFIIKLLPPYSSSSKVEVVKSPKVFFFDTGIQQMLSFKNLSSNTGNIFETSIFAEIVKKYGTDNLYFWRNKNGNEIDFILEKESGLLPIEVKTNFSQFRRVNLAAFLERYKTPNFRVVALEGTKTRPEDIYPWELD